MDQRQRSAGSRRRRRSDPGYARAARRPPRLRRQAQPRQQRPAPANVWLPCSLDYVARARGGGITPMTVAADTTAPVTQLVASFACDHDLRQAPALVFKRATRAMLDTIGVTIAGRLEPSFTILARTIGHGSCTGDATVLATRTRTQPAQAAFLNGTAGHALDFDDVADEIKGHPSVVLVPALLAIAEANGNSGRELLEAYTVGFEVG